MNKLKIGLLISVLISCVLCQPIEEIADKTPLSIEEALLGGLSVKSFEGEWISDKEIEYLDKNTKNVNVLNVATNKTEVALKNSVLEKYSFSTYRFSADRQFVLIAYDEKAIHRFSKSAKYVVYSVKDGSYYDVSKKDDLQEARWGPKGNTLVYIKCNNIYLIRSITDKMESVQITHNGKMGSVYNGIADWVYEEEILTRGRAFWFSPEGDQLAFLTFFETGVRKAIIPEYGEPADINNQYVKQEEVIYPKAGTTNPTFEVRHIYLADTSKIRVLAKHSTGREIVHDLTWSNNTHVVFVLSNRVQNESYTLSCATKTGDCYAILKDKNSVGWANTILPVFNKQGKKMLLIEGVPVENYGKFRHLVYYNGTTRRPLTGGISEAIEVLHWDEEKEMIYYSGTEEHNATAKQVFAVCESKGCRPVCLTCRIKSPEGRGCKDASALFSKKSSFVIVSCNGPDPKMVYLYKNTQPLDKPLSVLEDNGKLRTILQTKLLPEIMNLTVEVADSFMADVRLYLPPNMDRSGKKKYPMVIYVYGGPASKNIKDSFALDFQSYLSTNLSVIYGMIDGRNTLRKGDNMLFAGYRALGTYEMIDQINVTKTLQKKFPFIDSTRSAIWGWSYGGYATTKILELDTQNVFKCGVAVAPVADWLYYDSMYTERYMGLPQENKKGYEKSSVLRDPFNLRKKQYLLIHGNADDNVHYQNAMMIAKVLERNNIPFDMMSYPDEDHSLKDVRKHLYYTISRFWKRCFNL